MDIALEILENEKKLNSPDKNCRGRQRRGGVKPTLGG